MPLMKGRASVRRTWDYLNKLNLVFRKDVEVMTINYNIGQKASSGAYDFVFWHLPQIQYKNPNVQVLRFKNMTPSPYIQFFFSSGERLLVDLDSQNRTDILKHIKDTFCLTDEEIEQRSITEVKENPANFSVHNARTCMCEVAGQKPCPGFAKLPKKYRGKYKTLMAKEKAENS